MTITYPMLRELDLITPVAGLIQKGQIEIDRKKSKLIYKPRKAFDSPWITVKPDGARDCNRWLGIYFGAYRIIPKQCFGCFKIVYRPETLAECFLVEEVQMDIGIASKFGMEERDFCPHLYGAFWYVPLGSTLARAQQYYRDVQKALIAKLGRPVKLLLKRACTEMELGCGDSSQWGEFPPADQERFEHLLNATFVSEHKDAAEQTPLEQSSIRRRMIEWAWKYGDDTYKLYTMGQPLYPPSHDYSEAQTLEVIN